MNNNKILKIGHRGAKGHILENTIDSFKKAVELGVDAIELDVHQCKTGEIVVFHDDSVNRLTNGKGAIKDLSLKELKKLSLGDNYFIPTLEETLDYLNNRVLINIEVKSFGMYKELSSVLRNFVFSNRWDFNKFIVSSFNHNEIYSFRSCQENIKIAALLDRYNIKGYKFGEEEYVNIDKSLASEEFINLIKENLKNPLSQEGIKELEEVFEVISYGSNSNQVKTNFTIKPYFF